MTRKTAFGILAVLAMASFAISGAYAMECNDGKMAIISPSEKIACVTESIHAKLMDRGWLEMESVITMSGGSSISDNMTIDNESKSIFVDFPKPDVTFEFPKEISVGQTIEINYNYQWPDPYIESMNMNPHAMDEQYVIIALFLPDEFSADTENSGLLYGELYGNHTWSSYWITDTYGHNKQGSGIIQVTLNKPLLHNYDYSRIDGEPYQLVKTDNGAAFKTAQELGNVRVYFSDNDADDTEIGKNFGKRDIVVIRNGVHIPLERPEPSTVSGESEYEQIDYLPKQYWEDFAEMLRFNESEYGVKNFTNFIVNNMRLSEEFANDYLEDYPEFRTQSIESDVSGQIDDGNYDHEPYAVVAVP